MGVANIPPPPRLSFLSFSFCFSSLSQHGLDPQTTSMEALCQKREFAAHVLHELQRTGQEAGRQPYEIPGAVLLEPAPWSADTGELTITGKLRREVLGRRYKPHFDQLYVDLEKAPAPAPAGGPPAPAAPQPSPPVRSTSQAVEAPAAAGPPEPAKPLLDQAHFPAKGDFLGFEFKLPEGLQPAVTLRLQQALQTAKQHCKHLRDNLATWKRQKLQRDRQVNQKEEERRR